ncbi:hypothetical protein ENUP19_0144G0003 [Entamoeba nuttalli]|uniref:Protein kinase domain-containing protein n=3 Tax=Entamoeba nuttalli TaxID=412467 RepID=K2H4L5_ENTNP|nr:hypothetical protein ENU1_019430 [Entamoeba nuttalli P19]EKE42493.1 hypothetical protein ENU1_019430 [Entamoeba nuttalli P19]|eukprot:XP_008855172.1 hypothetical protein ENU1_019430 [Entamoeba nuttalli P19]
MGTTQEMAIYYFLASINLVFMVIELGIIIVFFIKCGKKLIHQHLYLFVFFLIFGLYGSLYFEMSQQIMNLILGLSATLFILGINVQQNTYVILIGNPNKIIQGIMVLVTITHFVGVIAIHSLVNSQTNYLIFMNLLNAGSLTLLVLIQWSGLFQIRHSLHTKLGIIVSIGELIVNCINILLTIHSIILTIDPLYINNEFIVLMNNILIIFAIFCITILSLIVNKFKKEGYEEFNEEHDIITNSYLVDISFLLHQHLFIEGKHSTIGKAIFLGSEVTYKQIPLSHLFDIDSLPKEIYSMKMINHPNLPHIGGVCRTNLNVYVIYDYSMPYTLNEIWNKPLRSYQIYKIINGMVSALHYLEQKGIIHYHLHSNNILINESCDKVIITDIFPLMKYWFINKQKKSYLLPSEMLEESYRIKCMNKNIKFIVQCLYKFVTHSTSLDINQIPPQSDFRSILELWILPEYVMTTKKMLNDLLLLKTYLLQNPTQHSSLLFASN